MAEFIQRKVLEETKCYCDIASIYEYDLIDECDFILLGGWVDRNTLNRSAIKCFHSLENKYIGLFATMGAAPSSEYGGETLKNLDTLLEEKGCVSLGAYVCHGKVHEKVLESLHGIKGLMMPSDLREMMIQLGEKSREATEDELADVANQYVAVLNELEENFEEE